MTARDTTTEPDPTVEADSAGVVDPGAGDAVGEDRTEVAADAADLGDADGADVDDTDDDDTADADADADSDVEEDSGGTGRSRTRRGRRRAAATPTGSVGGPRRRWPYLVLLLVAAVFAGVMVVVYLAQRPDPVPGLTQPQQAAVDAASQEAVNLQTYRRASFDQDFTNALAGATPDYGSQQLAPRRATLLKALQDGKRDSSASSLGAGLQSSTATSAVVLVVTQAVQTADGGQSTPFVFSRLQLTMQLVKGKWLMSDLANVGLS